MRPRYRVIIVGAGPAGSAAAFHLARAGASVLLVDRKHFPRSKVCGDVLTPRALRALAPFDIDHLLVARPQISGFSFTDGKRTQIIDYDADGHHLAFGTVLPRRELDHALCQAALRAGAHLRTGTQAVDVVLSKDVRGVWLRDGLSTTLVGADVIIVADGANGLIGRRIRSNDLPSDTAIAAIRQYWSDVDDFGPRVECHMPIVRRGRALTGYAWLIPMGDRTVNVGLALVRAPRLSDPPNVAEVFRDFLHEVMSHDRRFRRAIPAGPEQGAHLRPWMADPLATPPGVLLVGEAAGIVNPYIADGIAYAVETGCLAAQLVTRHGPRASGLTVAYARTLCRDYDRLFRLRRADHHYRLLASGVIFDNLAGSGRLSAAVRGLLLDRSPAPELWTRQRAAHPARRALRKLSTFVERALTHRLDETDTILSMLAVEALRSHDSSGAFAIEIAAAITPSSVTADAVLRQAVLSIALFALAHDVLSDIDDRPGCRAPMLARATIVIGDCLLTEAGRVAAALPECLLEPIAACFIDVARARCSVDARDRRSTLTAVDANAIARCTAAVVAAVVGPPANSDELTDRAMQLASRFATHAPRSAVAAPQ